MREGEPPAEASPSLSQGDNFSRPSRHGPIHLVWAREAGAGSERGRRAWLGRPGRPSVIHHGRPSLPGHTSARRLPGKNATAPNSPQHLVVFVKVSRKTLPHQNHVWTSRRFRNHRSPERYRTKIDSELRRFHANTATQTLPHQNTHRT